MKKVIVEGQCGRKEKKKRRLEYVQKVARKKKKNERAFQPMIQKFHLSKIKKENDLYVVVTCGALLFCIYLHGNLLALARWCGELVGMVSY